MITQHRQRGTWGRRRRFEWLAALQSALPAFGQVISYEATSFPEIEDPAWEHSSFCSPDRLISDGWLVQNVQPAQCLDPPLGDRDTYSRAISDLEGAGPAYFLEFRIQVNGDASEFPWSAPAVFAVGSLGPVFYGFTIARDQVKFVRDSFAETVFLSITPDVPHTFRLELHGTQVYIWYIDSKLVRSGTPSGPYPANAPSVAWQAKSAFLQSTVMLDFWRLGLIPADSSADFDTDIDLRDFFYLHECASTVGIGGQANPSCTWADLDADGDVDFSDFAKFQRLFTGGDNQ